MIIEEKKGINENGRNVMIKKFLKINNLKRFTRWLDQTNVHDEIRDTYFRMPWVMYPNERKSIERRLEETSQRDAFCFNRAKTIPSWKNTITRHGQYEMAQKLLNYVKRRYLRVRKREVLDKLIDKKMERSYEQKNDKKSTG